ncbi:MAG: SUMF1/EgtB/PvdO family nonheme iron enzyme, partial [Lentisphaeria bacterium]|nr:SUMF1/EgtB/PvdO family nonheme iron enzyme [Lentisphaeria bacterium]
HAAGLVHRDIKPENIIYVNGVPKLCDPGLVCSVEATASFVGTLGYLPQECFQGEHLNDPQRDVYALGKVLYVTVTGESAVRYPYLPPDMSFSLRRKLWPLLTRVCDTNPRHRFRTVSDFRSAMPAELPDPGRLELLLESFRQWRLAHPLFTPALWLLFLLLLFGGSTLYAVHWRARQKQALFLQECREQCEAAEKRFRERPLSLLEDQLDAAGETALAREVGNVLRRPPEDLREKLRAYRALNDRLAKAASRLVRQVPRKDPGREEILRISDANRSLLSSPLSAWLPEKERKKILKDTMELEKRVFTDKFTLKPGQEFTSDSSRFQKFLYVPSGAFRNKKGELIQVKHSFWCCDCELRGDAFSGVMYRSPAMRPEMPMTRMMWNDVLEYCYRYTVFCRESGFLPEGYIVRPLYTHEWQWACRGAWAGMGNATKLLKENSGGKLHAVRYGEPNDLGLYDMIGNAAEITVPEPASRQPHTVDICGGSYRHKTADPDTRWNYLQYQFLPTEVGTRLAVARGDMDFFRREFFVAEPRQAEFKGKHYELLVTNAAFTVRSEAEKVCRFLGGHLVAPDSPELQEKLEKAFWETRSFYVTVSGRPENGVWMRPDGKPYSHVPMPPIPEGPSWSLVFLAGKIQLRREPRTPGVICEWTGEEYRKRTDPDRIRKCDGILHSFRMGKKLYVLFAYTCHPHTARRIAKLLGARLAEPKNAPVRERFQKELLPWKDLAVAMGGVWKFGAWEFEDGTKLDLKLFPGGVYQFDSENAMTPGLLKDRYCALMRIQALLLELPLE